MVQVDSPCILHYSFQQSPEGLRCSYDQTHSQTEIIELGISNTRRDGQYINVTQITIKFPMGPNQANTMTTGTVLGFNAVPSDAYQITQPSPGVFLIKPLSGSAMKWLDQGLYLRFTGIVMNTTLGVCKIEVDEVSALNSTSYSAKTGWYWMGKYPYQFFMRDLEVDRVLVNVNERVNLSWQGAANATYTLYWNAGAVLQSADVTQVRNWQSPALQQDTLFQLVGVSVDGAQQTLKLEASVNVANPVSSFSGISSQGGLVSFNPSSQAFAYQNISGDLQMGEFRSLCMQSFRSNLTGNLAWIDIYSYEDMNNVTVELLKGPSNGFSTVWTTSTHLKSNQWNRIACPEVANLITGEPYTLRFSLSQATFKLGCNTGSMVGDGVPGFPSQNLRMNVAIAAQGGLFVTPTGFVGIGVSEPTVSLDVSGVARAQSFVELSDVSLKHNIHPLGDALGLLLQMRGVQYERRDTGQTEIGVIAQEVAALYPALVQEDASGLGAVAYSRLTAVLVEALKSLHGEVALLKDEVARLRGEVTRH